MKERLNKNEANDSTSSQWGNDATNEVTRKLLNQEHTIEEQTIYPTSNLHQSGDNNAEQTILNINNDLNNNSGNNDNSSDTVVDLTDKK